MELKEILNSIRGTQDDGLDKTASVPAAKSEKTAANTRGELLNALQEVLTPPATTKTAAETKPAVTELSKLASDLANGESEALQKEAQLYGAAMADGLMARLQQYGQAVSDIPAPTLKTASADGIPTEEEFEKFASENPELVKQAMELGYFHAKAQIDMLKQAAFQKGYADAQAQIAELQRTPEGQAKLAELTKQAEAQDLQDTFEKMAETAEGREKLATIKQGYDDTMKELEKMAGETFERGYNDTVKLLQAM